MKQLKMSPQLQDANIEIERIAREECGLDYFPVLFVLTDFDTLMEVTSYSGMPKRYPHWYFGMQQKAKEKQQGYGLSHIYELVINTDPTIAYLLDTNPKIIQKMVMAHVYGHADFFKNNYLFENTNRNMHNTMSDHAERIRYYQQKQGYVQVERFIETCLSLENLIDNFSSISDPRPLEEKDKDEANEEPLKEYKLRTSNPYMDHFVNPDAFLESLRKTELKQRKIDKHFPRIPQRDVLRFVLKYSKKLQPWQKEILSIVRDEAYYFLPQRRSKIMNEGWAVYWHRHIMEDWGLAAKDDLIEYAKVNAGVLATSPGQINPYHLGYLIWKDIEKRWDEGRHGDSYYEEKNALKRKNWNLGTKKGREKMFEVRATLDDVNFLMNFMTDEFIEKNEFYNFELDPWDDWYKIQDRDPQKIRDKMITPLYNLGEPFIEVINGNYNNANELLLLHKSHDDTILEREKCRKTLKNLYKVWGRTVHLATTEQQSPKLISFNGRKFKVKEVKQG